MAELSGDALVVLVQVLDDAMRQLKEQIDKAAAGDDLVSDWEEELMTYAETAQELRECYEAAATQAGNLPAYRDLVEVSG